jgi:hypothetical protein
MDLGLSSFLDTFSHTSHLPHIKYIKKKGRWEMETILGSINNTIIMTEKAVLNGNAT